MNLLFCKGVREQSEKKQSFSKDLLAAWKLRTFSRKEETKESDGRERKRKYTERKEPSREVEKLPDSMFLSNNLSNNDKLKGMNK